MSDTCPPHWQQGLVSDPPPQTTKFGVRPPTPPLTRFGVRYPPPPLATKFGIRHPPPSTTNNKVWCQTPPPTPPPNHCYWIPPKWQMDLSTLHGDIKKKNKKKYSSSNFFWFVVVVVFVFVLFIFGTWRGSFRNILRILQKKLQEWIINRKMTERLKDQEDYA